MIHLALTPDEAAAVRHMISFGLLHVAETGDYRDLVCGVADRLDALLEAGDQPAPDDLRAKFDGIERRMCPFGHHDVVLVLSDDGTVQRVCLHPGCVYSVTDDPYCVYEEDSR